MSRIRTIIFVLCLITFAAGAALGLLVSRPTEPPQHGSRIAGELDLDPQQHEKIREIWSEVGAEARHQWHEIRFAARQEWDQAILDLLGPDRQAQYEKIQKAYADRMDQSSQQRRAMYQEAQQRTRELLTAEQLVKYEQLIERRHEHGRRRPANGRRGRRGSYREHHNGAEASTSKSSTGNRGRP